MFDFLISEGLWKFLTSDSVGKSPLLQFLLIALVIGGCIFVWYVGERSKRAAAAAPPQTPSALPAPAAPSMEGYVTELDLAHFENRLRAEGSERNRDLYETINNIRERLAGCEARVNVIEQRPRRG